MPKKTRRPPLTKDQRNKLLESLRQPITPGKGVTIKKDPTYLVMSKISGNVAVAGLTLVGYGSWGYLYSEVVPNDVKRLAERSAPIVSVTKLSAAALASPTIPSTTSPSAASVPSDAKS